MDDLISRQAAIELWEEYHPYIAVKACEYGKRLRNLPSAERRGRWEYTKELYRDPNGNHLFYGKICSECNSVSPYDSPYCMNCGANMQQDVTLVGAKMDGVEANE